MKKSIFFSLLFISVYAASQNNIGIGTQTPHASAQLDVSSTTRGLLAPRMTTQQRTAVASPAKGLLVYDTDLNSLYHYNGSGWAAVGGGGGALTLPYSASVDLAGDVFKITNAGTGGAIVGVTTNEFGMAVKGVTNSAYGYGVYGYSEQANGVAVYGDALNATAVKGYSVSGLGVDARSTNNSAIKASILLGANANPVILATHAGGGMALDAQSISGTAIKGLSGSGIGVRGESNAGTGVLGYSSNNLGVSAGTLGGTAVLASAVGGTAIKGTSSSGYALDISGKVKIAGANTNPAAGSVLTSVDASGNAIWKTQKIAFGVYGRHANYTTIPHNTTRKMHFSTVEYDYGGNYNLYTGGTPTTTSSTFQVPLNGLYHFDLKVAVELIESSFTDDFTEIIATLKRTRSGNTIDVAVLDAGCCLEKDWKYFLYGGFDILLIAGDLIHMEVTQRNDGSKSAAINVPMSLSGHLVFAE